jgi:regulation of enolase protein 1 (concanavalin A-like superfamily)
VSSAGAPTYRIGTTDRTIVTIEDCSGCGLSGWGWNDNASGTAGSLGPLIYFANSGDHTIRVLMREDGLSLDQIVLSRSAYLSAAPGATKDDGTILTEAGGTATGTPPPPPPPPLPAGWQSQDIGSVGKAGSGTGNGTAFTVTGAGADVWGTADAFHYVYQTLSGDGTITARVAAISGTQSWTKVGVMIRGTTSASSAQAFMLVSTSKGLAFQRRTQDGGLSVNTAGGTGTAPRWVRLQRSGNLIVASVSSDGSTWTTVDSDNFVMPSTVLIGLAVSSHTTTATATGNFDNVTIQ